MVTILAVVLAALLSAFAVRRLRQRTLARTGVLPGYFPPALVRAVTTVSSAAVGSVRRASAALAPGLHHLATGSILEASLLAAWALWVGRAFLDFNPMHWPAGREFGIDVYAFHFWDQLARCGLCSLWNGSLNGGAPFLSDPFTGHLHPLAALATLAAGVVNGAKITILGSFFLAGLGQWWMAKVIGLSRWSRLWTALAATSGGYLVGRVELGSVADPLSASAVILALAAALQLALKRDRKSALQFGLLLGLALLAGHGYYQLALVWWIPSIALLIPTQEGRPNPVWRQFILAGALAAMVAAIFLIPFLHFWPQSAKATDASFAESQPLEYIPINLVVHDWEFLSSPVLGKTPYPYLNSLFIGWPAVVLAIVGIARTRRRDRRLVACLTLGALTMLWVASGVPMRWLVGLLPFLAGFRHVANVSLVAVPAILALSGYGLDRLLDLPWPRLRVGLGGAENRARISISLAWLLVIPLGSNLRISEELDRSFLMTIDRTGVYQGLGAMATSRLEWVTLPFGEHYWIEAGIAQGLKLTRVAAPWAWKDRAEPSPRLEASRDEREAGVPPSGHLNELPVYQDPSSEYAYVDHGSGTTPCDAQGTGGDLRVTCPGSAGRLIVQENNWVGWTATVDGQATPLEPGPWLSVRVPTGTVNVRFRYLPLDAALGAALSAVGLLSIAALWRRAGRRGIIE